MTGLRGTSVAGEGAPGDHGLNKVAGAPNTAPSPAAHLASPHTTSGDGEPGFSLPGHGGRAPTPTSARGRRPLRCTITYRLADGTEHTLTFELALEDCTLTDAAIVLNCRARELVLRTHARTNPGAPLLTDVQVRDEIDERVEIDAR